LGGNSFNFAGLSVSTAYQNFYKQTAIKLATLYGNHPAVMGFCFGNEQNGTANTNDNKATNPNNDSRVWVYYDSVRQAVKAVAPNKLFIIAFQDDQLLYNGTQTVVDPPGTSPPSQFNGQPIEQVISSIVDAWGLNQKASPRSGTPILAPAGSVWTSGPVPERTTLPSPDLSRPTTISWKHPHEMKASSLHALNLPGMDAARDH